MNLRGLALSLITRGPGVSSNFVIPASGVAATAISTAAAKRQRRDLLIPGVMANLPEALETAEIRDC
jgi:hypothetical protein